MNQDIRCVYLAMPGGMGDEERAITVSIGKDGAKWKDYPLHIPTVEQEFKQVFPPFNEHGWDLACNEADVPGWYFVGIGACRALLVHESIYEPLRRYQKICFERSKRNPKHSFFYRWQTVVDFLVSTL